MNRILRACGLVLVAGLAVGTAGCFNFKSDNEGKLEGTKWASAYVPDFKGISGRGLTMTLTFTDGQKFTLEMRSPLVGLRCSGNYRLGPGETVYLDDVRPDVGGHSSFTETISIAGDTLVMEDPDGTKIVFTKIDAAMEKAAGKGSTPSTGPKTRKLADGSNETTTTNGKSVTKTYGPEPKKKEE